MTFQRGQRVNTPLGPGSVAYQRMRPPEYREAEAVSVVLDDRANRPFYVGTVFRAEEVTEERKPPPRADCPDAEADCGECADAGCALSAPSVDALVPEEAPACYCGGCGEDLTAATTAAHHGGVPYCRGCEEAPPDPPDGEAGARTPLR